MATSDRVQRILDARIARELYDKHPQPKSLQQVEGKWTCSFGYISVTATSFSESVLEALRTEKESYES